MKKILLVAAIALTAATVSAQIKQGQFLVGGNAGFSSAKERDNKTTVYNITPNAGYFVIDKLAVGMEAGYQYRKQTLKSGLPFSGEIESKYRMLTFAPYVRYYFLPAMEKVNLFANSSYGLGSEKENTSASQSYSYYRVAAGPAFFVSPSVALEASVYYMSGKAKNDPARTNTFGVNAGFQVHLGKGKK